MNSSRQLLRVCPVCGGDDAVTCLEKGDQRLVRCRRCAMVYANPVQADLASGHYYDKAGADYYLSTAKLESDYADVRFERELALFRRHCSGGAVLDVGCSSGAFLYQLLRRFPDCYDALGTDVSGPPLDYAESRGVPIARGDFLKFDFSGKTFDAITFWAVLEHLAEPATFVARAADLLKPEGLCIVLVPNMGSLAARWLGKRYRYIYPQHLNYFTRSTLRRLVEPRFELQALHSSHFNPIVLWQDWRNQGREVANSERAALLARTTAYKKNPFLKPVKILYGVAERVLGAANLADNITAVLRRR